VRFLDLLLKSGLNLTPTYRCKIPPLFYEGYKVSLNTLEKFL
jgi:hypothetical protein